MAPLQNMYAQSQFFRQMVAQESHRLFQAQLKLRWIFVLALALVLGLAEAMDRPQYLAGHGVILTAAFALFNLALQVFDWRGQAGSWTIYATVLADHVLITLHLVFIVRQMDPGDVLWSPENLIFAMISLNTALRLSYAGLSFSLLCNFIGLNIVFAVAHFYLEPSLLLRLSDIGPRGHVIRVIFMLAMGSFFFTIPLVFRHLLAQQETLFRARKALQDRQSQLLEDEVAEQTAILRRTNQELRATLGEVQTLESLLPICSRCKKIKDDQGRWLSLVQYLAARPKVRVTHGLCEPCFAILYPEIAEEVILQLKDLDQKR